MPIDLTRLIPPKRFGEIEFIRMLKKLCPRGPAWTFPVDTVPSGDWRYLATYIDEQFAGGTLNPFWDTPASGWGFVDWSGDWAYNGTSAPPSYTDYFKGYFIPADADYDFEIGFRFWGTDYGSSLFFLSEYPFGYTKMSLGWISSGGGVGAIQVSNGQGVYDEIPLNQVYGQQFWLKVKKINHRIQGYYKLNFQDEWTAFSQGNWLAPETGNLSIGCQSNLSMMYDYWRFQASAGFPYANPVGSTTIQRTNLGRFLQVIAREWNRLDTDINRLLTESIPGLSSELLAEWERVAGLPDECSPIAPTVSQRQQIVHAQITQAKGEWTENEEFLPLTPKYFIDYASTLGMTVTIDEYGAGDPFRTSHRADGSIQRVTQLPAPIGIDGARLNSLGSLFHWTVTVVADPNSNRSTLECVVNRQRPAWTTVDFLP